MIPPSNLRQPEKNMWGGGGGDRAAEEAGRSSHHFRKKNRLSYRVNNFRQIRLFYTAPLPTDKW